MVEKIEKVPKKDTVSFAVNGMPSTVFADWNESCIVDYGDCRWVKMLSDHQKARQFDNFISMYSRVMDELTEMKEKVIKLDKALYSLSKVPEEEKVTLQ
jgi:hypothetical protein